LGFERPRKRHLPGVISRHPNRHHVFLSQGDSSFFSKPLVHSLVLSLQPPSATCLDANGELLKVLDCHMATHQ